MHQQHITSQTRRSSHQLLVIEQHVSWVRRIKVGNAITEGELIFEVHRHKTAIGQRCGLHMAALGAAATVAGDVVPHYFQAILRDGKGHRGGEVLQTVAAVHHSGSCRILPGRLIDKVRRIGGAVATVDR
ncbi:hypothetical protein D3C84_866380 [compost metagenome]